MLRVGIIGFGQMGRIRNATLEEVPNVAVAAIYDVEHRPSQRFPFAHSAREIIENPEIDAVFICLPNHLNSSTTIAALRAGKHVFCEKPPAFTAEEVRQIQVVEESSKRVLMYGFNHRHHEAVLKMKDLINSREHGDILWMRGRYGKSVDANYLSTWRADPKLAGGGILIDQGIHMLDLFLFLSGGSFDIVNALVSSRYWHIPGVEDNVFAILRNSNSGVEASLHSTMTQWRHLFSLEVFLERGYMVLNGLRTSSKSYGEEALTIAKNRTTAPAATWEDEERLVYDNDLSWKREVACFLGSVLDGSPVTYGSSDDAFQVMNLVDHIYRHERRDSVVRYKTLR